VANYTPCRKHNELHEIGLLNVGIWGNHFVNIHVKLYWLVRQAPGIRDLITDMRHLTTEIRYEKCVVRRFRRSANIVEYAYTNLDSIAYCTPRLYGKDQRFSNFLKVVTTFISQNVLRTTLLLSPLKANCLRFSIIVYDTQFTLI
jgi:hypothetical protein